MTIRHDTEDLNASLEEMDKKSRALKDSLKILADDGFDRLSRAATQGNKYSGPVRRDSSDIVTSELTKLMKQELSGNFQDIFTRNNNAAVPMSVVINNNASATVTAREGTGAFDQKYLEITIDQMVANSLLRGRQTSGVMRTLFGLAPSLMGR